MPANDVFVIWITHQAQCHMVIYLLNSCIELDFFNICCVDFLTIYSCSPYITIFSYHNRQVWPALISSHIQLYGVFLHTAQRFPIMTKDVGKAPHTGLSKHQRAKPHLCILDTNFVSLLLFLHLFFPLSPLPQCTARPTCTYLIQFLNLCSQCTPYNKLLKSKKYCGLCIWEVKTSMLRWAREPLTFCTSEPWWKRSIFTQLWWVKVSFIAA